MDLAIRLGRVRTAPDNVQHGYTGDCIVLNSNLPGRFWLRLTEDSSEKARAEMREVLDRLYTPLIDEQLTAPPEMQEVYHFVDIFHSEFELNKGNQESLEDTVNDFLECIGDYAVIFLPDERKFYRVLIAHKELSEITIVAFLIDEGYFVKCHCKVLWPMSKELTVFPHFAFSCYLQDLYPDPALQNISAPWSDDCIAKFRSVINEFPQWSLKIGFGNEGFPKGMLPVILFNETVNVNRYLLENGYAYCNEVLSPLEISKVSDNSENQLLDEFDPMAADYASSRNQYDVDVDDPGVAIYGHAPKDEDQICPFYNRSTGSCFKGASCFKLHKDLHPSGYTTDQIEIINNTVEELPLLEINHSYKVSKICIPAFDDFYVILLNDFTKYKDRIEKLHQYMNDSKVNSKWKKFHIAPAISEILLVNINGSWLRGKCLDSDPDNDSFQILLEDKGQIVLMDRSNLRSMEPELAHIPFLSRHCRIPNIRPSCNKTVEDISNKLKSYITDGGDLRIIIISDHDGSCLWVDLIGLDGTNLSLRLIEDGFAKHMNAFVPSDDSFFIPG